MKFTFFKYQGTGNDFIMIDNRNAIFPKENKELIHQLCNRNFGIGGDGLILLENDETTDFKMIYFNADGNESTMCGNGGRCIVAFANHLKLITNETTFRAIDGLHHARINQNLVSLQMNDVNKIHHEEGYFFTNTGSPHHIQLVKNVCDFDVFNVGKEIRYKIYGSEGSNVNFVEQINSNSFKIRTYERGVENETLACGTGATAVAVTMHKIGKTKDNQINIEVEGGTLSVLFEVHKEQYRNILLKGPAKLVFKGKIKV